MLSQINLDDGWREAIIRAMTNEGPQADYSLEVKRIENAMANLRKQHLWGVITDDEFRGEYISLEGQKKPLEASKLPIMTPSLDRADQLLKDLPTLRQHPVVTPEQRRKLAREVFEEIQLKEGKLAAVKQRPEYAPLFAYSVWRYNVVGGDQPL